MIPPTNDPPEVRGEQSCDHDNDSYTCFCSRKCAGLRGFQAHKRSCRVLDIPDLRLMSELGPDPEPDPDDTEETNTNSCSYFEYERGKKSFQTTWNKIT